MQSILVSTVVDIDKSIGGETWIEIHTGESAFKTLVLARDVEDRLRNQAVLIYNAQPPWLFGEEEASVRGKYQRPGIIEASGDVFGLERLIVCHTAGGSSGSATSCSTSAAAGASSGSASGSAGRTAWGRRSGGRRAGS